MLKNINFLISKKKENIKIGLDWGFSSLKLVILEAEGNTYSLKDARIIQLPSQELNPVRNTKAPGGENEISNGVKLSSLIKDLGLSGGVNLGICGPNVIVRYVAMAKMSEDEVKKSLRYEAASHLPFPVEEVNLDGVILKDLPDNQILVMLAAAKKDFINQRLKVFQEAGIRVNILDIDSLALINAFNFTCSHPVRNIPEDSDKISNGAHTQENNTLSGAVALLNIGASVTNINILEDGIPHFSRDINVAAKDFAQEASREITMADFVSEIRKSFDYYEAGSTTIMNKVFLSGGGSLVSGFAGNLKNLLDIPIGQWDPFGNFEFTPDLDEADIRKNSARFAVAVGLALR